MTATARRLVILGLDGATWTVLDPLRRLGLMPNLDALLATAAHGTLRSVVPPVTSAAWTSMMTGCGPAKHGIFDHRYFDTVSGTDEGQPLGAGPGADLLAPAFRGGAVGGQLERAGDLSAAERPRRGRLGNGRAAARCRALGGAGVRPEAPRGGAGLHPPLLLETRAAVARRVVGERPVNLRAVSGTGRGGPPRRQGRARLVGADGPVPEPRPVPASRLELPERR